MSVNKIILVGNLCADPELRHHNDRAVAVARIATNERWKDRDGNPQERTEYHRVTFWGRQAEVVSQYARKGRQLYIEGRVETREYEKDGERRWSTGVVAREFVFVGGRGDNQAPAPVAAAAPVATAPPPKPADHGNPDEYPWAAQEADLPF